MSTNQAGPGDFAGAREHTDMLRAQIVARESAAKYHVPWMVFSRDGVWYSEFEGTGPRDIKRVVYVPLAEGPYDRYVDGPATQLVTRRCEADEPGELELRGQWNSTRNEDGNLQGTVPQLLAAALYALNSVPRTRLGVSKSVEGVGVLHDSYDVAHAISQHLGYDRGGVPRG